MKSYKFCQNKFNLELQQSFSFPIRILDNETDQFHIFLKVTWPRLSRREITTAKLMTAFMIRSAYSCRTIQITAKGDELFAGIFNAVRIEFTIFVSI